MFWRYDVIQVSALIFVVCQAFWILYTFPSRKVSYQQTCAVDLVQNIEHQKQNKTREPMKKKKKSMPCKWEESAMCSNNSRTSDYPLIPGVSSWKSSSYRSKLSPALSSFVVATVTIILAEPVTCAVYCSVDIAQRKHHSRVQAPVIIPPPRTQTTSTTKSQIYISTYSHTTHFSLARNCLHIN